MYKKHFNKDKDCKKPYAILKKEMIFIGKLSWVVHSEYSTEEARNNVFETLRNM